MTDEPYPHFVISYEFDGAKWGLTVPAKDWEEMARRLRAIGMTGTVDGILEQVIPAYPAAGLYVRAKVFLFNLFGR